MCATSHRRDSGGSRWRSRDRLRGVRMGSTRSMIRPRAVVLSVLVLVIAALICAGVAGPSARAWTPSAYAAPGDLAPMPTAREELGIAVGSNGHIYVIG